jgi:hypothetical protein
MRFRTSGTNWEGRAWTLAPCLVVLGQQISVLHPRGHGADGTVASKNHDAANPTSDHRPTPYIGPGVVRALDFGETTEDDVFDVLEAIRRSRDPRVKYVIHERELFSSYPSGNVAPFNWRPYSGPAPHDDHGHISALAGFDTDTRPWAIVPPMALTPEEERFVKDMYRSVVEERQSNGTFAGYTVDHLRKHPPGGGLSAADVKSIINDSEIVAPG